MSKPYSWRITGASAGRVHVLNMTLDTGDIKFALDEFITLLEQITDKLPEKIEILRDWQGHVCDIDADEFDDECRACRKLMED